MEQSLTTTDNGLTQIYNNIAPTKEHIIERLFKEEKITIEEVIILLQESKNLTYIPIPQPYPVYPYSPYYPQLPWTVSSTNNQKDGNS